MGLRGANRPLAGPGDPRLSRRARGQGVSRARPRETPCPQTHPAAPQDRPQSAPSACRGFGPPKNMETGVRPLLLPEGHTAPRNRTCRRPKVLRARSSSSGLPAPGLGSKTRELSPAPALPLLLAGPRPRPGRALPLSERNYWSGCLSRWRYPHRVSEAAEGGAEAATPPPRRARPLSWHKWSSVPERSY